LDRQTQKQTLFLVGFALLAVLLIAAGLPYLKLEPGLPIPGAASQPDTPTQAQSAAPAVESVGLPLLKGSLALAICLLLPYILYLLLCRADWKKIARLALILVACVAVFLLIPSFLPAAPTTLPPEQGKAGQTGLTYSIAPIGSPPPSLIWLVGAGLLVLLAAGGVYFYRRSLRLPAIDPLLDEAEQAVRALQAGQDLKSVILRCYLQMSLALQAQAGLERGPDMTPREFESLLAARGVPAAPVRQLTRLFEAVRYGHVPLGAPEEEAAVDSLTAITRFLGQGVRQND